MSSFEDNYDAIVENNKNEILGILNQLHAMGPAYQAFLQVCKQHKIKPLRKRKGQYNPNKRHLSAYNIFTQEVQNDKKLKDKSFQERSKLIGGMWKKVKENKKEHQKYKDMAESRKKNAGAAEPEAEVAAPVKKKVGPKKGDKKHPAVKPRGHKKKGEKEKVVDPSEVSEDEVFMDDSDDVFDSDDDVSE